MRLIYRSLLFFVFISFFQNCGEFKSPTDESLYSYSSRPDFFYDLRLVKVEIDSLGRKLYEFDLVVSFASDPDRDIHFQIAYSTLNRSAICPTQEFSSLQDGKHHHFQCLLPTPDTLYVRLSLILMGPEGKNEVRQYSF